MNIFFLEFYTGFRKFCIIFLLSCFSRFFEIYLVRNSQLFWVLSLSTKLFEEKKTTFFFLFFVPIPKMCECEELVWKILLRSSWKKAKKNYIIKCINILRAVKPVCISVLLHLLAFIIHILWIFPIFFLFSSHYSISFTLIINTGVLLRSNELQQYYEIKILFLYFFFSVQIRIRREHKRITRKPRQ